jgi:hypothetical protein
VQLFAEVKRHKPSVIYIPGIDTWYHTLSEAQITTFLGLLRAIPPTDPVLVLGITDAPPDKVSPEMLRDLFGFSRKNRFTIERPARVRLFRHPPVSLLTYLSDTVRSSFLLSLNTSKKLQRNTPSPWIARRGSLKY